MKYAESEFALNAPESDGQPLRAHLESVWRQTGTKPAALEDAIELPPLAAHVWGWFISMHAERGSNGMTHARITSQAMRDFCWAEGVTLELWERRAIRAVDAVWMKAQDHG